MKQVGFHGLKVRKLEYDGLARVLSPSSPGSSRSTTCSQGLVVSTPIHAGSENADKHHFRRWTSIPEVLA
jgi:hypothetical protein